MTHQLTLRRALAALATGAFALTALTACGDDAGDGSAHDTAAGSAALAGLHTGDQVDPGDFVDTVAAGLEQSTTAHVTMKTSLGQAGDLTGEGDLDYTADPPAMAMTMTLPPMMGESSTADVRFVDGVFYLSFGDLTAGKFVKLDPSDPSGPFGGMGSMLEQMDPAAMLHTIEPAIDEVTYDGEEDVDGRSLGHYELTVDGAELGKAVDAPDSATAQLPDTLAYDIWLDDQNRLSKFTMDFPVQGTDASVEMSVTGWGEDVTIEAPPADQVTDMPGMFGNPSASPQPQA